MKSWNTLVMLVLLALYGSDCNAQSDQNLVGVGNWVGLLEIRFPGALVENDPITMQVPSDGCLQSGSRIDPDATTIVRNGNTVTIDFYATQPICFSAGDPLGVWIYDQALGSFAEGSYTVDANFRYSDSGDETPFAVLTSTLNVIRGAAPASPLPILSASTVFLLVLALGLVGLIQVRLRRLRT